MLVGTKEAQAADKFHKYIDMPGAGVYNNEMLVSIGVEAKELGSRPETLRVFGQALRKPQPQEPEVMDRLKEAADAIGN